MPKEGGLSKAGREMIVVAMLAFALKVAVDSATIAHGDFDALLPHAFSDEDIWDSWDIGPLPPSSRYRTAWRT
jgi:hypothetical protein